MGAVWFLQEIYSLYLAGKRGDYLLCAPTIKILNQSTLPKFKEWFPDDWGVWREQRQCFELVWGDKIYTRSADEPDYLEGLTALAAWLDEAGQMDYEAWVNIQGRLSINQGRAMITTTPYTKPWLKKELIQRAGRINNNTPVPGGDQSIHLVTWTSVDNPAFPEVEYQRMEKTLSPEIFKRRYQGKFTTLEGLVYKSFSPEKHIIKPFPLPADWVRFGGADFGNTNPTAIIPVAKKPEVRDKDGKVIEKAKFYVYRELYKVKPLLAEIHTFLEAEGFSYVLGDPSAAQQMDELKRYYGFTRIQPADNKIDIGIERIDTLLREDRLFFFEDRCPNTIREISEYHYPAPSEDRVIKDKPVAINNHAMDALKYAFSRDITGLYQPKQKKPNRKLEVGRRIAPRFADNFTGYF